MSRRLVASRVVAAGHRIGRGTKSRAPTATATAQRICGAAERRAAAAQKEVMRFEARASILEAPAAGAAQRKARASRQHRHRHETDSLRGQALLWLPRAAVKLGPKTGRKAPPRQRRAASGQGKGATRRAATGQGMAATGQGMAASAAGAADPRSVRRLQKAAAVSVRPRGMCRQAWVDEMLCLCCESLVKSCLRVMHVLSWLVLSQGR